MPEGTNRNTGRNAQRNNIMAAILVAEAVKTTLGPKGMDKMLVDSLGDITVTNDGVTILEEMNIEHPVAKMIAEVAKTQEFEVGDGTTTAVVFSGELLKNAEILLEKNIHPTIISKGYRLASEKAQEILNKLAKDVSTEDTDILKKIAETAMTGKGAEGSKEWLAELSVLAVTSVIDEDGSIDINNVKVEKKVGTGIDESELVKGIVIDKERIHQNMPKKIINAKIALLNFPLEIKKTGMDSNIQITDPKQMQTFIDQEEVMIKEMVNKIKETEATVVICQKGIDELAQHFLAKEKIFALRNVKKSDLDSLARATGATIATKLEDLKCDNLGNSGIVEEKKVGHENMTYVEDCKNPKSVTLLVRGGTEHVVDEIKRAIDDALGDVIAALKIGKVVTGAGATDIELSNSLYSYAQSLKGREQLAVEAFAEAVKVIPVTLAENAGLDPIDILTELKQTHDKPNHETFGINVFTGKIVDAWQMGVIEPLKIKTQAIKSASEVANMILRIDDVISSSTGSND